MLIKPRGDRHHVATMFKMLPGISDTENGSADLPV
jgi:hypothetical protein